VSLASDLEEYFAESHDVLVAEPLKFKAKLGIGEKAYALVRAKENLTTFTEALGVGSTASAMASSGVVASTFFAKTGLLASALSVVGMGTAAATPLGWVVGAGLLFGTAYFGISRTFDTAKDTGLVIIPKYINTPLDLIAMALIELMLPLSLKIAHADGELSEKELEEIYEFFLGEWGYSEGFLAKLVEEYSEEIDHVSYATLGEKLGEYCQENRDCDPGVIAKGLISHLREVVEADGQITNEEKSQLEYLEHILTDRASAGLMHKMISSASETLSSGLDTAGTAAKKAVSSTSGAVSTGADGAKKLLHSVRSGVSQGVSAGAEVASSAKAKVSRTLSSASSADDTGDGTDC
jgi:uncharacterized tellurite resistance protein B-like protein